MKHGFIGFGNMAKAIYNGLKEDDKNGFAYVSKNNKHKEVPCCSDIEELVKFSDVIWLGVKPKDLVSILVRLKNCDLKGKVVVSPVAGKKIGFIEEYLGKKTAIVRIMPNLAIAYKQSVTAFCANSGKAKFVKADLKKLGKVVELPEKDFEMFTAIFGCGPAFLLAVLRVFKKKIGSMKISEKISDELLLELLVGTTSYLREKQGIDELIKKVASKGGSTEAGLKFFKNKKVDKLLEGVINEAAKRFS